MLKNQVCMHAQIWKKTHINSPNLFWSIREILHNSVKAEVWGSKGHQDGFLYREVPVYVGGLNLILSNNLLLVKMVSQGFHFKNAITR